MLCLLSLPAVAAEEDGGWKLVVQGPITVKNRPLPGTAINEVWAEGELAAPAIDVQDALMDIERLTHFMPYIKDARVLGDPNADGTLNVYTLIDLPVVGKRDYIQRLGFPAKLAPDGSGTFRAQWSSQPDFTPERHGVVRVRNNQGSWVVTKIDEQKARVSYRFTVDPGGWLPAFLVNLGNETGVKETYLAVQKEAQRRAAERSGAAKAATR